MKQEEKKIRKGYDNELRMEFDAISCNEGFARMAVSAFITPLNPTLEEMADVKTAVSEAVTNAIIHGYERREGMVELYCAYQERKVYIEVADQGRGIEDVAQAREPLYTSKPELERSGMGFTIMETFMENMRVESVVGEGTRVYMEKTLSEE